MGEQPIFTTKAHVFQIDPSTKKKWLPACSQAVNVSYYYDNARNTYRIISVDGTKAIINSTLAANMQFTKTSQKFGQWSDPRANTVYGLGFGTEADCTNFVEKFKEIKEILKKNQAVNNNSPDQTNGDSNHNVSSDVTEIENSPPVTSNIKRPSTPNFSQQISGSESQNGSRRNSGSSQSAAPNLSSSPLVDQLKYENDRLKIALAQSSANAKKWEVELQTLKNNNARLTTALQESTSNVEEWKKQLSAYKEESARMKKKVLEMEKLGGSELLQKQLSELRERGNELEMLNSRKDSEISDLTIAVDKSRSLQSENQKLQNKIQELEKQKETLKRQEGDLRVQINNVKSEQMQGKQNLHTIQEQLQTKLQDVLSLNSQLEKLTQ